MGYSSIAANGKPPIQSLTRIVAGAIVGHVGGACDGDVGAADTDDDAMADAD
jgi:hypothetical protein